MCTFCTDIGHGERWYMNFENYLYRKVFLDAESLQLLYHTGTQSKDGESGNDE